MRLFLIGIMFALLAYAPFAGSADELKRRTVEQFEEKCSAVELTLIIRKYGGVPANLTLRKGERSGFVRLDELSSLDWPNLLHGEMVWHCGDTSERSECNNDATHVRVQRAATGRNVTFTCYRVESCKSGTTVLDTLDERCRQETLRVGNARIKWLETKENIPYASAKLNDSGGVRWTCGGAAERSTARRTPRC